MTREVLPTGTINSDAEQLPTITPGGGGGGASAIYFDPNPPVAPTSWLAWWNTEEGALKIWYTTGEGEPDSDQWVDAMPARQGRDGTNGTTSPLTTKGDVWGYSSVDARIPVGSNNQALIADSAQTLGVKWASTVSSVAVAVPAGWGVSGSPITTSGTITLTSPLTTKGDLYGFSSQDVRVPVGSNGQVLIADSTAGTGVTWSSSAGVGSMVKLSQVVTTASATTVTFSNISGAYTNLLVVLTAADGDTTTGVATIDQLCVLYNSDTTSANYIGRQSLSGTGSVAAASTTTFVAAKGMQIIPLPNRKNNANALVDAQIWFNGYAQTTFYKSATSTSAYWFDTPAGTISVVQQAHTWKNTAAITNIVFTTTGTGLVDGSIFTLYGIA